MVALLTLSQSMTGEAKANLESYGANIVVTPKAEDVALSYGGIDVGGVSVGEQGLDETDVERVRTIPAAGSIAVVAPEIVGAVRVKGRRALMIGVDPGAVRAQALVVGRSRPAPQSGDELIAGAGRPRCSTCRWATTCASRPALHRDRDALADRRAGRELLVAELGSVQRLLDRPGELTLIEVAASYSGAPVDEVVRQLSAALPQAEVSTVREAVASRLHAVDHSRASAWSSSASSSPSRCSWCSSP